MRELFVEYYTVVLNYLRASEGVLLGRRLKEFHVLTRHLEQKIFSFFRGHSFIG